MSEITIDQVIVALGDFIQPIVGLDVQIVRAQVNRVPQPGEPCIVLTELHQTDLETYHVDWSPSTSEATYTTPSRCDVQIDFYAPNSGDLCRRVITLLRSLYAPDQFPDGIKPLYCSDGIQAPLLTAEQQWESRWTTTASLQYNSGVTVPQAYFDTLGQVTTVTVIPNQPSLDGDITIIPVTE